MVPEGDGGHWKVMDYMIDYDALSEAADKNLWSEEEFGDFQLHVDWRFKGASGMFAMPTILPDGSYKTDEDGKTITEPTPNSDSGIFLRGTTQQVNIWNWGIGSGELWGVRTNPDATAAQRASRCTQDSGRQRHGRMEFDGCHADRQPHLGHAKRALGD